jgi:hypothetical protein
VKRAIISYAEGDEHKELAGMTWPLMQAYADLCGAEFVGFSAAPDIPRHPSWKKLACIADALVAFDEVLWLDTDVVVATQENIFDEIPEGKIQATVEHHSQEGHIPNMGVWLCRKAMAPWLVVAAMQDQCVDHKWWEQAAMMHLMGYSCEDGQCRRLREPRLQSLTHYLDERWNFCSCSKCSDCCFFHACGLVGDGRLSAIKELISG